MSDTRLGTIKDIHVGRKSIYPHMVGVVIEIEFNLNAHGVTTGARNLVPLDNESKVDLRRVGGVALEVWERLYQLLEQADVDEVIDLVGMPVIATLDAGKLVDFRIVEELLSEQDDCDDGMGRGEDSCF